jgi:hypothetical protein
MMDESAGTLGARPVATPAVRALGLGGAVLRVVEPAARLAGTYAALAASLLVAQAKINALLAAVQKISPMPAMRMDIVCWRTEPLTQSRTYSLVALTVGAIVLLHALVVRLLQRWPLAVVVTEGLVVAGASSLALRASPFLGNAFFLALPAGMALLAPFVLPERRAPERVSPRRTPFVGATALQAIPLAWGVWITTFEQPLGVIFGAELAALGFSLWRVTRSVREEEEATAGLAFLPLPIVGLLRAPSWGWVIGALGAYGAIRLLLRAKPRLAERLRGARVRVWDRVVVATLWSICAIFTAPYRFRDFPRLNHLYHEAGSYGWTASVLHGKLMMADAGLVYGPLRSYALALYVRLAGITAEQIRLGQALMSLGSLALMVSLGWRLARRRAVAMGWYLYLLLVGTIALDWMNYQGVIAFGWADLGRIAIPLFALVGGIDELVAAERAKKIDRESARRLCAWGVGAVMATLWAQEFGACTIAGLLVVPVVHPLLRRGRFSDQARFAAAATGFFASGIAAGFAVFFGVYALYGKVGLFVSNVALNSSAFASGSFGALQFPATEVTFLSWQRLMSGAGHEGYVLEYVLPPAVYFVTLAALVGRAVGRRWGSGDALTLAVLVFGLASFRFALGRTDYLHMVTTTLPAILLVVRLAVEAASAVYVSRYATWALRAGAAATMVLLAIGSLGLTGVGMGLQPRVSAILAGTERPSSGPPYAYPGIPRAGDVKIQPEYVKLVEAIVANSSPRDKLFQHIGYMDGGEVYFLADRVNPTRFDVLTEFVTSDRQHLAFEEVERDPPKLTVGEDWGMTGPELNQYLKDNYHPIGDFGGFKLLTRNE